MIKALKIISVLTLLVMIAAYLFVPGLILKTITDYEPYTFEKILENPWLVSQYGIGSTKSPEDYNYASEEVSFQSLDGIRLDGWFVRAKKSTNRSIVLVHGRTSNRLKTMKYLALVDSLQLDTLYNVFIPDLRNSGRSDVSSTFMGYKFAEDVAASMMHLNHRYDQDSFILYGFSMGAMAICNTLNRSELKALTQDKVHVEKIIFDSPLVNVKETIRTQVAAVPVASYFFDRAFQLYSSAIDGFGESMKISSLYDERIPTLILQSKDDSTTTFDILEYELKGLPVTDNLRVVFFEGPGHVKIFQDERTRAKYIKEVGNFLSL
jgi:pimeloyl-ACP methyl ester carboxylesterase